MTAPRNSTRKTSSKATSSTTDPVEVKDTGLDFAKFQQLWLTDIKKYLATNRDENYQPRKYNKDQIRRFLAAPDQFERQLREVSQYMGVVSQHYQRVVRYFSSMLTLDYILMPINTAPDKMVENAKFRRNYQRSADYLEQMNIKHEFEKIIQVLMNEGVYFGYEREGDNTTMIQRLPANFCRVTGIQDGIFTFAFNFNFFNSQQYGRNIEFYPPEFKELFATAMGQSNGGINSSYWWQELDATKAVCFKWDETVLYNIPPLTGAFEDIMDLQDYRDLTKQKTKLDNWKLLVQKIPMKADPKSEKDFVISLESVKRFHDGVKANVPDAVGVISTPMDVTDINFEKAANKDDVVGNAERNYYNTVGVSSVLFNSGEGGMVGLNRSIEVDQAFMFQVLRQIERFFRKRLQDKNENPYHFKAWFLDITVYNRDELLDKYLKAAEYGFPKSMVAATLGVQLHDLTTLLGFESDYLGLRDILVPLASSHTMSVDEGGRPQADDNKLSESGAATRDGAKNDNKTK